MNANVWWWLFEVVTLGHHLIKSSEYNISLTGVGREGYLGFDSLHKSVTSKTVLQWSLGIESLLKNYR